MDSLQGEPRCVVIGDGAIGAAITSRLQMLKINSLFVGRKDGQALRSRFEGWGQVNYLDIRPLTQSDISVVDLVFVAVKAFDLGGALDRYLPYLPKGIPVIPLANGAIEELLLKAARRHPDYAWRIGLCTFGVSSISEGIYCLRSSSGKAIWGPLERRSRTRDAANWEPSPLERDILERDKGVVFQWQDHVIPLVRRKWLFNIVINSLTAALDLETNGALLNDMKNLTLVFDEAYRLGIELWGSWDRSYDKLLEDLVSLISATAQNENSMARDVRLGKRTENDFLAKLALGRRDYDLLGELAQEIEKKTKYRERR